MARYVASREGMMPGYWKIVDTTTGNAVESGMRSKAATVEMAARLSADPNRMSRARGFGGYTVGARRYELSGRRTLAGSLEA